MPHETAKAAVAAAGPMPEGFGALIVDCGYVEIDWGTGERTKDVHDWRVWFAPIGSLPGLVERLPGL